MENISHSEIPNSSPSLFLPSEPPDIRNWFPSYQYESFVLDTYDSIGGSLFNRSDSEEDKLAVAEGINGENFGNLGETVVNHLRQPSSKGCKSSAEFPFLSGIRLDRDEDFSITISAEDDFEGSVSRESGCEKKLGFKESRIKSEGRLGEQRDSYKIADVHEELLVKSTNSFEDTCAKKPSSEIPDSSQTPFSEPPDISKWFASYVYKSPESSGLANKEPEGEEDFVVNQQKKKFVIEDDVVSCKNKDRISKRKLILSKDLSEKSETKVQTVAESCGINGKENEEKEASGNGFVTTKNRPRLNKVNSFYKPKSDLHKSSRKEGKNSSNCEYKTMERRVFLERTNLKQDEAIEVTGKWQCPQSRKPKLGPPLKQIRLERWINKL